MKFLGKMSSLFRHSSDVIVFLNQDVNPDAECNIQTFWEQSVVNCKGPKEPCFPTWFITECFVSKADFPCFLYTINLSKRPEWHYWPLARSPVTVVQPKLQRAPGSSSARVWATIHHEVFISNSWNIQHNTAKKETVTVAQ